MKTYWDYSDIERAAFTDAQVTALLDVEMMEKGVLKPKPPQLEIINTPDNLGGKQQFFGVTGKGKYGSDETYDIVFASAELAQRFLELKPLKQDYDYEVGSDFKFAMPISEASIKTVDLFEQETIMVAKSSLKKNKAGRDSNERLTSAYNKACTEANKVTNKVWEDWHCVRATQDELSRVVSTFKEYKKLASDDGIALVFLGKIFDADTIQQAREWFPDEVPTPAISEPLPFPKDAVQV